MNDRCSKVEDQIDGKMTLRFRFEKEVQQGLLVDFTACVGLERHHPLRVTNAIKDKLDSSPHTLRQLALLTVVAVKQRGVAWDGKGSIGQCLKPVHWVLLNILRIN